MQTDRVEKIFTPEELIRFITPFTVATTKAVAAGNSCRQEDVIVAANMGRKSVYDVLRACKVSFCSNCDRVWMSLLLPTTCNLRVIRLSILAS